MNKLQKYGVVTEKKVSVDRFYQILCLYKDKGDVFPFETYSCTFLDDKNIITFVSPNRVTFVKRDYDRDFYYNTVLSMDEALKILNPYLRKYKIEKIKGM